jgi:putative tricarboxylic transport membrane protein
MRRNLATGIGALLIGAGYLAMAYQLRASALADSVGPAGLPKVLGFLMVALGAILCVQDLLQLRRARSERVAVVSAADGTMEAEPEDEGQGLTPGGLAKAGGFLLIAVGYLLVIKTVGYPIAIGALIILLSLYGGIKPTWRVFAIGVAGAVVFWTLFVEILALPLPAGVLSGVL